MKEEIFNFNKPLSENQQNTNDLNIVGEEVVLTNKHIEFIQEVKESKKVLDFGREKGEKTLIKNLLNALEPILESQSEEVKKSYEYFKIKCD